MLLAFYKTVTSLFLPWRGDIWFCRYLTPPKPVNHELVLKQKAFECASSLGEYSHHRLKTPCVGGDQIPVLARMQSQTHPGRATRPEMCNRIFSNTQKACHLSVQCQTASVLAEYSEVSERGVWSITCPPSCHWVGGGTAGRRVLQLRHKNGLVGGDYLRGDRAGIRDWLTCLRAVTRGQKTPILTT